MLRPGLAHMTAGDAPTESAYAFRAHPWSSETTYRQNSDGLAWNGHRGAGGVSYAEIREVQVYKVRYLGSRATYWRCILHYGLGRRLVLQAAHFCGLRRIEDRTATSLPFIKKLEARIAAANPDVVFRHDGGRLLAALDAVLGALIVLALRSGRLLGFDRAAASSAWVMRNIGPWLKGQRTARTNLAAAFPDKPRAEIERILLGMWDNIGRTFVEYGYLDRLWDYDPRRAEFGRIVFDDDSRKRFLALRDA